MVVVSYSDSVYDRTTIVGGVETWNLICFEIVSLGLVLSICGMATQSDAGPEYFRSYLGQVAGYHFALVSRLKSFLDHLKE